MENAAWQAGHAEAIKSFLAYLNSVTDKFILKGGTALMICYGLDRFSEDIDLDGQDEEIEAIVAGFCTARSFSYRTAKDTATVKRYMIQYGNAGKPLKVEISYRKKTVAPDEVTRVNGISVYKIGSLCLMKANAYAGRDRIRDLYDLVFICNHYWDELTDPIKAVARGAVEFKGIEQFDYLLREQDDELINKNVLAEGFLNMYDNLGLLYDERERQLLDESLTDPEQGMNLTQ